MKPPQDLLQGHIWPPNLGCLQLCIWLSSTSPAQLWPGCGSVLMYYRVEHNKRHLKLCSGWTQRPKGQICGLFAACITVCHSVFSNSTTGGTHIRIQILHSGFKYSWVEKVGNINKNPEKTEEIIDILPSTRNSVKCLSIGTIDTYYVEYFWDSFVMRYFGYLSTVIFLLSVLTNATFLQPFFFFLNLQCISWRYVNIDVFLFHL